LSAYFNNWSEPDGNTAPVISDVDTKKFIRFDKYGIYGINHSGVDGLNWYPKWNKDVNGNWISPEQEIDNRSTFALTWEGLKVTGTGGTAHIGKHNNAIIRVTKKEIIEGKEQEIETFLVEPDGDVTVRGNLKVGNGNSVDTLLTNATILANSAQQTANSAQQRYETLSGDISNGVGVFAEGLK
jgi:hypothetical protein